MQLWLCSILCGDLVWVLTLEASLSGATLRVALAGERSNRCRGVALKQERPLQQASKTSH